jgi:hypothetical protein
VLKVSKAFRVFKETKAIKEIKVLKVSKAFRVFKETKVIKAIKVQ